MANSQKSSLRRKMKEISVEIVTPDKVDEAESEKNASNESECSRTNRKRFSFHEKAMILNEMHNKQDIAAVCAKYDINERALRAWRKDKIEILEASKNNYFKNSKKRTDTAEFDNLLYAWLLDAQAKGIPVTGPILKQKALSLKKDLAGPSNFKASEGWIEKWKKRKGVRALTITGEKLSADYQAAEAYKKEFRQIVANKKLSRSQIFNFDESGLYYKMVPKKTLAPKSVTQVSGSKKQLERVTISACCNADGTFKLPLLLIGKSANPRCLKHLDKKKLPVYYRHQSNSWVDKKIFEAWFVEEFVPRVEDFLESKNLPQTAALLIDNCKAQKFVKVRNIEVAFLPPNVTSLLQPLDQGILQAIKLGYQSQLVDTILTAQSKGVAMIDHLKAITIKEVIYWVAKAWDKTESSTIYKCWKELWPVEKQDAFTQTDESSVDFVLLDSAVGTESIENSHHFEMQKRKDLLGRIQAIQGYESVDEDCLFEWLQIPGETQATLTNDEIIEQARNNDEFSNLDSAVAPPMKVSHQQNFENNLSIISSALNTLYGM